MNWMVRADLPTPPPPTTTSRYFSCTEPSFQPAIGDTSLPLNRYSPRLAAAAAAAAAAGTTSEQQTPTFSPVK